MLCEIGVEGRTAVHALAIMCNHFVQRFESPVVHVRAGHSDIAQRGYREFAFITVVMSYGISSIVPGVVIKSVICKALALKKRLAMTVKTIRADLSPAWIILGVEEVHTAFFHGR